MHSIRPRPICRARNTFSPSIALWQHFVAPNQHLPQRPHKSSFTTEATQSRDIENVDSNGETLAAEFKGVRYPKVGARLYTKKQQNGQQDRKDRKIEQGYRGEKGQDTNKLLIKAYEAYDSAQDYEGVVVNPVFSVPVKESRYPWVIQNRETIKSGDERLNLELQKFHDFIRPNQAESVARKHVIEQVRQHVRELLPNYVLEVFGSERTGIAFAASDIDLRLIPEDVMSDAARSKLPPSPEERARRRADLKKLHLHLMRRHKKDYLLPMIRWARYPLISLQDRASGLSVQLVLSNDTSTSREYMQRYMQEYPHLPQLYSVLKATLDVRGLSDVFRGGIGSYSLFMMIVASLKHKAHPCNNAASALKSFLQFWSQFKAEQQGLSIEPPEFFAKSEQVVMHEKAMGHIVEGKIAPLPPWMLTLRDPADETNDLGRKAVAWKHVRVTYKSLITNLRKDVAQNTRVSLLARLVGPIYGSQKAHRKRLANYGRSLVEASRLHTPVIDRSKDTAEAGAGSHAQLVGRQGPDLDELAAIARSIREGETANKQSACKAEVLDKLEDEKDEANPWLKDIVEASDHKETGEAFANLLGLDKKPDTNKQEE